MGTGGGQESGEGGIKAPGWWLRVNSHALKLTCVRISYITPRQTAGQLQLYRHLGGGCGGLVGISHFAVAGMQGGGGAAMSRHLSVHCMWGSPLVYMANKKYVL